jgi:hypothetical protein
VRLLRRVLFLDSLFLLPLVFGEAEAQARFEPLAPRLDSMRILLVRTTDERDIGMLWDETTLVRAGDTGYSLRRVYRTINKLFGNHLDTVYSTVPDLRPISHRAVAGTALESIQYRSDSIVGWVEPEGKPRRRIARSADRSLYDAHTFDLLIRRAPLHPGYQLSVPALLSSQDTVATLKASVTGAATVQVEGGREAETWVVELDFAGLRSTMWVDKASRRLARQTIQLAPGVTLLMDRLPRVEGEVRERRGV